MLQILIRFLKKKCKDLMQQRKNIMLPKIGYRKKKIYKMIQKKETKCLYLNIKNLKI